MHAFNFELNFVGSVFQNPRVVTIMGLHEKLHNPEGTSKNSDIH